jgi:hypothetical protein
MHTLKSVLIKSKMKSNMEQQLVEHLELITLSLTHNFSFSFSFLVLGFIGKERG